MAEQMHDAVSRDSLLSVAQSCEYLARFAPSEADLMASLEPFNGDPKTKPE
jgi:hypothetical protein